jgi:hypothetical protein
VTAGDRQTATRPAAGCAVVSALAFLTLVTVTVLALGAVERGFMQPPQFTLRLSSLELRSGTEVLCLTGFRNPCDGPYFVVAARLVTPSTERGFTLIRARIAEAQGPAFAP